MLARATIAMIAWVASVHAASAQYATSDPRYPTCPLPTSSMPTSPPEMQIRLETSSGGRVLVLQGGVVAGNARQISSAISQYSPIDEIWVHSNGGDAEEGNRIAQVIRASGIPTRIPNGWWCISACNFVFFGGVIRYIDPAGVIAVHMATVVNHQDPNQFEGLVDQYGANNIVMEVEKSMALLTAFDIQVIIAMGISRDLLTEVMYQQSNSGLRCLRRDEMRRYNVTNVG